MSKLPLAKYKNTSFVLLLVFLLIGLFTYLSSQGNNKISSKNIKVTTSIYPLYYFATQIGGDKIDVINITPPGAEPHDYEPSSQDIVNIESSNLLILNGIVEPWGNKITEILKNKNTKVIVAGNGLFNQKVTDVTGSAGTDPHIWLSPILAKREVNSILNGFISIDPANKYYYSMNANKLNGSLDRLDKQFQEGLNNCQSKEIITSHEAFGYLASEYGLNQIPIAGLSPDTEPSLKTLTEISNQAKTNNIKYIFFESLVTPKLADTIANEVGAKTLVLNPLEGLTKSEIINGKDYLTVMQDNLQNLRIALNCR